MVQSAQDRQAENAANGLNTARTGQDWDGDNDTGPAGPPDPGAPPCPRLKRMRASSPLATAMDVATDRSVVSWPLGSFENEEPPQRLGRPMLCCLEMDAERLRWRR